MEKYMNLFGKLSFILLVTWIVLTAFGATSMPGTTKQAIGAAFRRRGKGLMWNKPVTEAPDGDDELVNSIPNVA